MISVPPPRPRDPRGPSEAVALREPPRSPSRPHYSASILHAAAGIVLRDARKRRGLFQHEVAARVGVSSRAFMSWESGREPVPAERIPDLCRALDIPETELDAAQHVARTPQERELLQRARLATEEQCRRALRLLPTLASDGGRNG